MKKISILSVVLMLLSTPFLFAEGNKAGFGNLSKNSHAPIEATADSMVVDSDQSQAKLSGNVEIIQGDMHLYADFVRVIYDSEQPDINKLYAEQNVILISGEDRASADEADYDLERGSIILKGNASIIQDGNIVQAEQAEIDIDTGAAILSGRVRTILRSNEDVD